MTTTTGAWAALRETDGPCVLFESTSGAGPLARLSILARRPRAVLVADGNGCVVRTATGARAIAGGAIPALRALLAEQRTGRWPDEGGVAGALAYDFARPRAAPATALRLVALAVDRFEAWETAGRPRSAPAVSGELDLPRHSSLTRDAYRGLVRRIQEHIAAGDIYQANLSQRFELPWPRGGLRLYAALREVSPAPFSGYLRAEGIEIVSASPERLLSIREDGLATTRPIAGTRPRALADTAADRALAAELLLSEKERAEHLMLVDLARNDLGQVARIGSVAVDELMTVEDYSHVRHIVSNVRATLAPGRDAFDALGAVFPGGTITGVPKRRCMEILDDLEPTPRGFYTGALFYATRSGRFDANILIRSAVVAAGRVAFHAGGGIVADSDPDREYAETLHKAEALRVALIAASVG